MNKTYINLQANLVNAYPPEFMAAQVNFIRKVNELSAVITDALISLCEYTERIQGTCGSKTVRTCTA